MLNLKTDLDLNVVLIDKFKWNLPFTKLVIEDINDKNKIRDYLLKYKLKSIKKNRYKYWKLLLKIENKYLKTSIQDLNKIEEILKKLESTIYNDELNKI